MKFDKMLDHPILIPPFSIPSSEPSCHSWTFRSLSGVLGDKKLSCRVWRKSNKQVLETACQHVNVSLKEFHSWLESNANDSNPLKAFDKSCHAAYIDYKYMKDVFNDCPQKLQEVEWADFGLPEFGGKDSTIWIGSAGANTPGHQDSYGFNLVKQIVGRKMWVLFPPTDTNYLYPTRVPYEESSIFSQVHIGNPDIEKHPDVKKCHPVVVILHAGQTLYIPRHWWHYVESLDPSISINVWVPHKDDSKSHLTESLTRCLATSLLTDVKSEADGSLFQQLLNPTETLCPQSENIHYLRCAIEKVLQPSVNRNGNENLESTNIETVDEDCGKDCSISGNSGICDHLRKFGHWLRNSCNILLAAPVSPCLGTGNLRHERNVHHSNNFVGCIAHHRTNIIKDVNHFVFGGQNYNSNSGTALTDLYDCCAGPNVEEKNFESKTISCKRGHEIEIEKIDNRSKRCKNKSIEGSLFSDNDCLSDTYANTNTHCFSARGIKEKETQKISSPDVKLKQNKIASNSNHIVYSLTKPLSCDHYLHLMKINKSCVDFERVHSSNPTSFTAHRQSEIDISTSTSIRKETERNFPQCMCTTKNDQSFKRSRFPDSNLSESALSPSPSDCRTTSIPNSFSLRTLSSSASFSFSAPSQNVSVSSDKKSLLSHTENSAALLNEASTNTSTSTDVSPFQSPVDSSNKTEQSDTEIAGHTTTESEELSVVALSEEDIQTILFESVLHPSVVGQIASVFKDKCENLLRSRIQEIKRNIE